MSSDLIVIHTHFHKRRTGVTRSIENVLPQLKKLCTIYLYGYGIKGEKMTTSELKKLLFSKKSIVVHCQTSNTFEVRIFIYIRKCTRTSKNNGKSNE